MSFLKKKLSSIAEGLISGIKSSLSKAELYEILDELEEALILSDVSYEVAEEIIEKVKKRAKRGEEIKSALKDEIVKILEFSYKNYFFSDEKFISLIVGVNGGGKTTTAAKLANLLKRFRKKPLLSAADTFRAAGSTQLEVWAERLGIDVISGRKGEDPGAVVYKAVESFKSEEYDALVVDTAGRMHTKEGLMRELEKVYKIVKKSIPDEPKEVLLVLDSTIGQNAIFQAKEFLSYVPVNGIVLTKLDGTAKGGIIISISKLFKIPVKFIGLGEGENDIAQFDSFEFVELLFE